jgi:uncharacterized protein (TIRG00374 family)
VPDTAEAGALAYEAGLKPAPRRGSPKRPNGTRWRRAIGIAIGIAISALCAYLALEKISFSQVGTSLEDANYIWLIPAILLVFPIVVLRAWRWKELFDDPSTVPFNQSFAATSVGLMFNNLLPSRVGEVPRIFALRRTTGHSAFEIGATLIVERVLDVFAIAVIGAALWPLFPDQKEWVDALGLFCVGVVVFSVLLVAGLALFRERLTALLMRLLKRLPFVSDERADEVGLALVAGSAILLRPRRLVVVLGITFLIWATGALSLWVLFPAFDLDTTAAAPWLILVANTFAIMIPSGPAGVGVYEASVQVALIAGGVGASTALAYAVVLHAVNFFPVILLGAVCSWWIARQPPHKRFEDQSEKRLEPAES